MDDGDDQHTLIFNAVDHAVAVDETLAVGGSEFRHLAPAQRELGEAPRGGNQLLNNFLGVERRVFVYIGGDVFDIFDASGDHLIW